jgi:hypothetical protein
MEEIDPEMLTDFKRLMHSIKSDDDGPEILAEMTTVSKPLTFLFESLGSIDQVLNRYEHQILPEAKKNQEGQRTQMNQLGLEDIGLEYDFNEKIDDLLNEPIRSGYVELHHKVENIIVDLVKLMNSISGKIHNSRYEKAISSLKNYGIEFHRIKFVMELDRIRLIANSVKHQGGRPKEGLLQYYPSLDLSRKIQIPHEEFLEDGAMIRTFVIGLCSISLSRIFPIYSRKYEDRMEKESFEEMMAKFGSMQNNMDSMWYAEEE